MFGLKKKPTQNLFKDGYQDAMKLACMEYMGTSRPILSWMCADIDDQAYLAVAMGVPGVNSLTATFEEWADPRYVDGVVSYLESLSDAIKRYRRYRAAHPPRTVKVMM